MIKPKNIMWKQKVIRFVKWLINLKENQPPFIVEERKIQKIISTHIITEYERQIFPEAEIKLAVARNLLSEMLTHNCIKFEYFDKGNGDKEIRATTYVPEKL